MDRVLYKEGEDWMFEPLSTSNVFYPHTLRCQCQCQKQCHGTCLNRFQLYSQKQNLSMSMAMIKLYHTTYSFVLIVFSRSSSSSVDRVQHKGVGDWMFKLLSTSNIFILSYICVNANAKTNANVNAKDNVIVPVSTDFSFTLRNRTCQCQWQ